MHALRYTYTAVSLSSSAGPQPGIDLITCSRTLCSCRHPVLCTRWSTPYLQWLNSKSSVGITDTLTSTHNSRRMNSTAHHAFLSVNEPRCMLRTQAMFHDMILLHRAQMLPPGVRHSGQHACSSIGQHRYPIKRCSN